MIEAIVGMWKRVGLSVVLCLLALFLGAAGFASLAALKPEPSKREQPPRVINVTTYEVDSTDLVEVVTGFGRAEADREVVISAQVSGEVISVSPKLEVGEEVSPPLVPPGKTEQFAAEPNKILVRIDPQTYEERVEQAERRLVVIDAELKRLKQEQANNARVYDKVKADLEEIQKEYDRIAGLFAQGVASDSQRTRAALELSRYRDAEISAGNEKAVFPLRIAEAEQRLEATRSDLDLAKQDLARTTVYPTFRGRLAEVHVEQGQFVRTGDPLVRLADIDSVQVPINLTLTDYAKVETLLKAGVKPQVRLMRFESASERWTGVLERVAPEADETTRTIKVYVHVDNTRAETPLLPGTVVQAAIDGPTTGKVVVVPRDAVQDGRVFLATDFFEEKRDGTTIKKGIARKRQIEIDRTLRTVLIIKANLAEGEQVILTNLDILNDGNIIRIDGVQYLRNEIGKSKLRFAQSPDSESKPQSAATNGRVENPPRP